MAAVFVVARRGTLLLQSDRREDYSRLVLDRALAEPFPVRGMLGDWELVEPAWLELTRRRPGLVPAFCSREILFRKELDSGEAGDAGDGFGVRLLGEGDFADFEPLRLAYLKEEGLRQDLTPEQFRDAFRKAVRERALWGIFRQEGPASGSPGSSARLVGMVGLNARHEEVGQVGGVFTVPELRGRGLAKAGMRKLMADCAREHGMHKLILFTGEKNVAAQALYDGLGFSRIGSFGIIFE